LAVLTLVLGATHAEASVIGSWIGSSEPWNTPEFSTIRDTILSAGHTFEADEPMTAADLANDDLFLIQEPGYTPSASELSDLAAWINAGGLLIIQTDSDGGAPSCNAILSAIGSSMSFEGTHANAPLSGGIFATEGPPYNIVGQLLVTSAGFGVVGGNALAGTYARYEELGNGYVFAFGNRPDHNFAAPTSATVNGQLFLNLAAYSPPTAFSLALDIMPGDCPNEFNLNTKGKGRVPMAILGTESFNVTEISIDSIVIGGTAFPVKTPSIDDVSAPAGNDDCACPAGTDGYDDLVLHFLRRDVIDALGLSEPEPGTTEAVEVTVEGYLEDGTPFEATDCITLKGRGH
jgi:hypothetical protein